MSQLYKFSEFKNNPRLRLSPVAYYLREFNDSFYMDFHSHAYLEFMYCIDGYFTVLIEDQNSKLIKTLVINKGQFIFLNTKEKHKLLIDQGNKPKIANIEFAILYDNEIALERCINYSQFFINYLKDLYDTNEGYVILQDNHLVEKYMSRLIVYLNEHGEKDYIHQSMNVLNFFFAIRESLEKEKEGEYAFIRKAIQYIYNNISRQLSIEEIANYVGKSPSYFAHKFKEDRGVSVLKYINNARIDKARFLLKNSSESIGQIAKQVGFKNKGQLNYQFQAMINCTPSEYKKKLIVKSVDNTMVNGVYDSIDYK